MNELFTFNSHQFQVLQPPPHKPTLRKRIVKTNDGSRYSTPLTSSTTSEENQHEQSRQSKENIPKRVSFCEIASPESHKIESNGVSSPASEEIQASSVRVSKTAQSRRATLLRKLTSMEVSLRRDQQKGQGQEPAAQTSVRRQRRFKSLKQAPKVVCPLSDRKLPKVFKNPSCDVQAFKLPSIKIAKRKKFLEPVDHHEDILDRRCRAVSQWQDQSLNVLRSICKEVGRASFTPLV